MNIPQIHLTIQGRQIASIYHNVIWPFIVATLVFGFCTGCNSTVRNTMRQGMDGADRPTTLDQFYYNYTDANAPDYYMKAYKAVEDDSTKSDADRAKVRNNILNDMQSMIDTNYNQFKKGLRVDDTVKNTTADIITLGLTAAATATGTEEIKTILAGVATGVQGVNLSFDKNVFLNNSVQNLQLAMDDLRAQAEVPLIKGKALSDADYGLEQGKKDLANYYEAGDLTEALLHLTQTAAGASTSSKTTAQQTQAGVQQVQLNQSKATK